MAAPLKGSLLAAVAVSVAIDPAIAAPTDRPPLTAVTAVRASNYGAPSRLIQQRDEVKEIIEEVTQLRKKPWRRGDTKMRCYATVVLLEENRTVAMFRVRPELIVERPIEKGGSSYSLKLSDADLPRLTKLLGEIPKSQTPKCD